MSQDQWFVLGGLLILATLEIVIHPDVKVAVTGGLAALTNALGVAKTAPSVLDKAVAKPTP